MTLERRGVPTALVAVEKLARTTGRGMARAQGMPDLPIAVIDHAGGIVTQAGDELEDFVAQAGAQIERILLDGTSDGSSAEGLLISGEG